MIFTGFLNNYFIIGLSPFLYVNSVLVFKHSKIVPFILVSSQTYIVQWLTTLKENALSPISLTLDGITKLPSIPLHP